MQGNAACKKRQDMEAALESAVKYIYGLCCCGVRVMPEDKPYFTELFFRNICCHETIQDVYRILIKEQDKQGFARYAQAKADAAKRIYGKYFAAHTVFKDGRYFNSLTGMYWDKVASCWVKEENGHTCFSTFMPGPATNGTKGE